MKTIIAITSLFLASCNSIPKAPDGTPPVTIRTKINGKIATVKYYPDQSKPPEITYDGVDGIVIDVAK